MRSLYNYLCGVVLVAVPAGYFLRQVGLARHLEKNHPLRFALWRTLRAGIGILLMMALLFLAWHLLYYVW